MNDREFPPQKRRQRLQPSAALKPQPRVHAVKVFVILSTLAFSAQILSDHMNSSRALALSWEGVFTEGQLWKLLSYPFAAPIPALESPLQAFFFPCELLIPILVMLALGGAIERRIGTLRFVFALLTITLLSAIPALILTRLWPSLGAEIGGPFGIAFGLLPLYLFLFEREHFMGAVPVPVVFLALAFSLIAISAAFAFGFAPENGPPVRNHFALLPTFFAGAGSFFVDRFAPAPATATQGPG